MFELARLGNLLFASAASTCGHRRSSSLRWCLSFSVLTEPQIGQNIHHHYHHSLAICAFYGRQWNQMPGSAVAGRSGDWEACLAWPAWDGVYSSWHWAGSFPWLAPQFQRRWVCYPAIAGCCMVWDDACIWVGGMEKIGRGKKSCRGGSKKICMATVSSAIAVRNLLERGISW